MSKNTSENQENNNNEKKDKKFNIYWIYGILLLAILAFPLLNVNTPAEEVSKEVFFNDILPSEDVEKIVVVNKEQVEVYLTEAALKKEK